MPKQEWGVKRVCPTTGRRFYDLNKDPIISPYTGEVVALDTGTNRSRVMVADKAEVKTTAGDDDDNALLVEDDADVLDDSDGADVELDDDVLDEDEDDTVSLDDLADVPAEDED
ncbi:MAG: TIGR02300 family protein [Pseudomonadota bacterium]